MAVFSIHTWRPLPGRAMDLVASMVRAQSILEAKGALVTLWQPIAGGDAGSISFVAAYEDSTSYGRTMQAVATGADWQEFWTDAMADPSGVNVENYMMNDLDATAPLPTVMSRVLVAVTFRTRPGRLVDHLGAQATACGHLERLGARVRSVQTVGRSAGTITTLLGFEDFLHYGEFGDKFAVDEGWTSFWLGLAADPPADQVESGVSTLLEIPA